MLAAPGPEPVGEPQKILFVNLVEDRHYGLLDDLILQGCDAQGTLPSIGFRDVGSLGRLRAIRSPMDAAMQVRQLLIQARLVLLPRHAVDSGRRFPLQRVVALPQQLGRDMVEQRGEPRPLVPTCCFTHTVQVAQLAGPALSPGRGRLPDVLLGRSPSLHALRRCLLTLVRTLRRYYATVRLPTDVHVGLRAHGLLQPARRIFPDGHRWGLPVLARGVSMHAWGLRLRRVLRILAMAHPPVLPSAMRNDVGTLVAIISQLNTLPACAPVNASMAASRLATHDSGSGWFATPFLYDSFIHNSTPVYPGALRSLLGIEEGCFLVAEEREDGISAKMHSPSRDRDTGCVEWDAYFSLPDRGGMRKHPIKRRFGYPKHRYRWRCALSEPQSVTH